jgi:hypothetical protein
MPFLEAFSGAVRVRLIRWPNFGPKGFLVGLSDRSLRNGVDESFGAIDDTEEPIGVTHGDVSAARQAAQFAHSAESWEQ